MSSMYEVSEDGRKAHDAWLSNGKMKSIRVTVSIGLETSLDPLDPNFQRDIVRLVQGYDARSTELNQSCFLEVDLLEVK